MKPNVDIYTRLKNRFVTGNWVEGHRRNLKSDADQDEDSQGVDRDVGSIDEEMSGDFEDLENG